MIQATNNGCLIKGSNGYLNLQFYKDNIVRVTYTRNGKLPSVTPAVIAKPSDIGTVIEENIIKTKELVIEVNKDNLSLSIYNSEGVLLNRDNNISIEEVKIEKELLWEKGFYGMGEKYGWINQKGTSTENYNSDVLGVTKVHNGTIKQYHTSIPFYIGLDRDKSYGIYFDNSFKTYFDFGKTKDDTIVYKADGGVLDYYFIYNRKISNVVSDYCYLTGTMPLPRKDFLGYQQCRWSYENKEELMEIARKMREKNIPCDVLYLDIDYMKNYKVFTVDSDKFNDFKGMVKELKEMGYKLVVIIDPGVKVEEGYKVYKEGKKNNYYIKDKEGKDYIGEVWPGAAVFPDFLRKEVREWWAQLHKDFVEDGVEGFWNDMNEPADFTTESKVVPEDCIHLTDSGEKRSHREIHNLYGMLEAMSTYEGLKKLQPNKRPFVLTRAAFSGTQRYAALWTGDNTSLWEHLEASMPMLMNLGLSGYSFIGSDVGGFAEDCNGELLTRWTQLGVFTPLFRNHSIKGSINQEPWCFGEEVLENTRKYIRLRYQLITYLYNLMKESSEKGHPVIRPLFYHYQDDENTYNINDQFLFGESIMVCPVTRPGTKARMVYLPEGEWHDYWTKEKVSGGKYIIRETPIDILPIYIKAGSIIPQDEVMNYIGQREGTIHVHFYTGDNGAYDLYLDDGISFDYEEGIYSRIKFSMKEDNEKIVLKSYTMKDSYKIHNLRIHVHGVKEFRKVLKHGDNISIENNQTLLIDISKGDFKLIIEK